MRFGRIILASLAPLIGFSALMSPPASGEPAHEDVVVRLWHTVVQLVAQVLLLKAILPLFQDRF